MKWRRFRRWVRLAVAGMAVLVGSHRLVVDHGREEVRDVHAAVPVQRLALDPALDLALGEVSP